MMFTQSFENSERQRQRRQQRELALRRMEEAAGGDASMSYSSSSFNCDHHPVKGSPNAAATASSTTTHSMTSADYASNFLKRHTDGSGGDGDTSIHADNTSKDKINNNSAAGSEGYDVKNSSDHVNLHDLKRSFPERNNNKYYYHNDDDDDDADENDDSEEDGENDNDSSMMLQPTDRNHNHHRRMHYLDREGNMMTNHVLGSIATKRTWRRSISWMAVCATVVTITILIIVSVVVSVVGSGSGKESSVSNGSKIPASPLDHAEHKDKGVVSGSRVVALSPKEQERFDAIRNIILQQHISTSQSLSDTSSPQYAAIVWLTRENDGQQQQQQNNIMELESVYLLQRYGLAVLWYSTTRSEYQWHMSQETIFVDGPNETNNDDNTVGKTNLDAVEEEDGQQRNRKLTSNNDPNLWFRHNKWLSSSDICTWEGIACHTHREGDGSRQYDDNTTTNNNNIGLVASIELRRNNVQGLIPEELYPTLPSLKVLDLSDNGIAGTISAKISTWKNLECLNFTSNNLAGSLPSQIGQLSSLREMQLAENQLTHSIPHTIGNMSRLKHLDLSGNLLRGTIPYELGNLEELSILDLSWNALAGPLPHELSKMQTLVKLDVCHNDLVGPFLLELSDVRYLTVLRLNDNHFSGEVPSEIGTLVHLEELRLNNNNFRGFLPSEISNLVGLGKPLSMTLAKHSVEEATLTWLVPQRLKIHSLPIESLNVANNQLKGPLPQEWTPMAGLRELDVSHNELSGEIPYLIDGMKNLHSLNMAHNHFSSSIPPEIGSLYKLEHLYLNDNKLVSNVPMELGELDNLKKLTLHNNKLRGTIDDRICKLTNELFLVQLTADCGGKTPELACSCCICP